jgi:putative NADPH-quinone reductase
VAIKIVAVVGSYRKGGTIDSAVDAMLEGAAAEGAETAKIYLLEKQIEFCTNCRSCAQQAGLVRGKCVLQDDLESVLSQIEAADAIVLAAPVNFFNVNAMFRRFMERLVGYVYWPWDKPGGPLPRNKARNKIAALVTSTAMPGFLIPISTGAPRALRITAKVLGAKPVATLWIGLSAVHQKQELAAKVKAKAKRIGFRLARPAGSAH